MNSCKICNKETINLFVCINCLTLENDMKEYTNKAESKINLDNESDYKKLFEDNLESSEIV